MAKIEINALKNSTGSIFALGLWGLIIGIIGGVLGIPRFGLIESDVWVWISTGLKFAGSLMQFFFFLYFANACKNLGNSIFNQCAIIAYSILSIAVLEACQYIFHSKVFALIALIPSLISFIIFIILALKFKRNYSGLLGSVGAQMIKLIQIGCIIIGVAVFLLILFIIEVSTIDPSYVNLTNPSIVFMTVIQVIVFAGLGIWFLAATVKLYSKMDELMVYGYEAYPNTEDKSENQRVLSNIKLGNFKASFKRNTKIIYGVTGGLVIVGIVFLVLGVSGVFKNPYDKYFADINIEEISPTSLAEEGKKDFVGLRITKNDYSNLLDLEYYNIKMRWEPSSDDPSVLEVSVVFKNIYEVYDDIYGIGYLKGDELEIYRGEFLSFNSQEDRDRMRMSDMLMFYHDEGFAIGRTILGQHVPLLKAKVKNLASFEATFYESYTGQESKIQLYDENTWNEIRLETKVCVFSNYDADKVVSIQLIRPYDTDNFGAKAIVLGSLFYEERDFYTVINSENQFSLGEGEPMPFFGIATWKGDRLKVDDMEGGFFYMDMSDGESF